MKAKGLCKVNLAYRGRLRLYVDKRQQTGAVVEWLERLTVVRKVAGSSPALTKDWKTLTVHPAANGYLINFREG